MPLLGWYFTHPLPQGPPSEPQSNQKCQQDNYISHSRRFPSLRKIICQGAMLYLRSTLISGFLSYAALLEQGLTVYKSLNIYTISLSTRRSYALEFATCETLYQIGIYYIFTNLLIVTYLYISRVRATLKNKNGWNEHTFGQRDRPNIKLIDMTWQRIR